MYTWIDRRREMRRLLLALLLVMSTLLVNGEVRNHSPCEQGSCYPATGDLLIGRESRLKATSTCGLARPERYCVVSHLEHANKCFTCDSRQPWAATISENSHRIENIVSSFKCNKNQWWQAASGQQKVSIQLDLEAEFHFTHLIMTFKTFRPKAMVIERSFDFGKTWREYRYFAHNCDKAFPAITKRIVRRVSDVICEQKYSSETPSTSGEVIFRVLPPFIPIPDPYSQEVQDLLKLTNLRINFTELHTLGDIHFDQNQHTKEKYYYAVYDLTVRGSCSCYGHASRCLPVAGYDHSDNKLKHMVHGMCECTHNTKGLNCEMCQDFYHDLPWSPARPNNPQACKRCNCNNHATECHFDAARYLATGRTAGGVCDNCMHNTRGIHCQECKPLFYQDSTRDIRDPKICQSCDCDTHGSEHQGICEQVTDSVARTVAGRCLCKPYVTGARCDTCKVNYWNLQADNPLGCEACRCSPHGSLPDVGCDKVTGDCICKRYAKGKTCSICHTGFYGLSADNRYGCYPCDCDIGGALLPSCDPRTGQCQCRPHIRGKQCRDVDPYFFYAHLDYYLFEAEYGKGISNARIYIREHSVSSPSSWTGPGFMNVMEGDSVEVQVSGLPTSTHYDIIIRYDNKMPDVFRDVRVSVIRPGQVDRDGPCGGYSPGNDLKSTSLHPGVGHQLIKPPSCLEKGVTYIVHLDFKAYIPGQRQRAASLLIDSIVLMPNVNYLTLYRGQGLPEYYRNEFLQVHCDVLQFSAIKPVLPDLCQKHTFSISAFLHNGAIDCDCHPIGSTSLECNPSGGQCQCRPNVVGRRCDQCAPGTYGFGPRGCLPCNCHATGASSNFCNDQTGQCTCIENVAGRACDQCSPGLWGFPQCRPCQCNDNADKCDTLTGVCLGCRNFTAGSFCERCEIGYYGDPRAGVNRQCQPCLCPRGPGSSVQHADTCSLHHVTQEVHCHCQAGYTGRSCDVCVDNYFGAPTFQGSYCQPCACNNNIDPDIPGSCNGTTGQCLKCLYNTHGFVCELCLPGFFGDARKQNCAQCVCNPLGMDDTKGHCDPISGQCPCLPNTIGQQCDRCAPGHWDFASGQGCAPCNCDLVGSLSSECNLLTGVCACKPGRGGPRCADCENLSYGDPNIKCHSCDCNNLGSKFGQCDRRTGQCVCLPGVAGLKCDSCARGTMGELPNCVPCGECFDNWERVIGYLKEQTNDLVKKLNALSVSGPIRVFDKELRQLQRNIDEVTRTMSSLNYSQSDIGNVRVLLEDIKMKLTDNTKLLNKVDEELRSNNGQIRSAKVWVHVLNMRIKELTSLAKQLHDNVTNVELQEVGGASGIIKEAAQQSRTAQQMVDKSLNTLAESETLRLKTEGTIIQRQDKFQEKLLENERDLGLLESDILELGGQLSDINEMVCGQTGAPCSALCGGGGCGRCGGDGCSGSVTLAHGALTIAQRIEKLLKEKSSDTAHNLIPKIEELKLDAMNVNSDAKAVLSEAVKVSNQTSETNVQLETLLQRIKTSLLGINMGSPTEVEQVAKSVLAMEIPLKSEVIENLSKRITLVVSTLSGFDKVLNETAENRATATKLKQWAQETLSNAKSILTTALDIKSSLSNATQVQLRTEQILEIARNEIIAIEEEFDIMTEGHEQVKDMASTINITLASLKPRLDKLASRYTVLQFLTMDLVQNVTDEASRLAKEAKEKAQGLQVNVAETIKNLTTQHNNTSVTKSQTEKLKTRADAIFKSIKSKMIGLKDIHGNIANNEQRLMDLHDQINKLNVRMDDYLGEIRIRTKYYETC